MNEQINKIIMEWLGEDKEFEIQADGEYHFDENQKVIAHNFALDSLRSRTPELVEKIIKELNK